MGSRGERPLAVLGVEQRTYLVCGDTELTMHLSLNNVNVWRMQWLSGTERAQDTGGGGGDKASLSGCFQPPPPFPPPHPSFLSSATAPLVAPGSSSQLICGRNQQGVCRRKYSQAHRLSFFPFSQYFPICKLSVFLEILYFPHLKGWIIIICV